MIMNKMLALCMSPDQGGLELYFIKFHQILYDKKIYLSHAQKTHILLKILLKIN